MSKKISFDDLMSMSDEEFDANTQYEPEGEEDTQTPDPEPETNEGDDSIVGSENEDEVTEGTDENESDVVTEPDENDTDSVDAAQGDDSLQGDDSIQGEPEKSEDGKEKPKTDEKKDKGKAENTVKPSSDTEVKEDYEKLYKDIMKPFKANGAEITPSSPEEVIRMMQMGANYHKKMQAIKPSLKVLRMLENNKMLDEEKINHLIDLSNGNKDAVAKFIKDNNIDPLDINIEDSVNYKSGNHTVADEEINFRDAVDEVKETPHGRELINQAYRDWDEDSKNAIYEQPELIRILSQQKEDGIYSQIANQIEKEKLTGNGYIARLPFIQAYQVVGKAMAEQGMLKRKDDSVTPDTQPEPKQEPKELGRGVSTPKKANNNSDKAKAAAPSGKTTKQAKPAINPLSMSDAEFEKLFGN